MDKVKQAKKLIKERAKNGKIIVYTDAELVQLHRENGCGTVVYLDADLENGIDVKVEVDVDNITALDDDGFEDAKLQLSDGAEIKVIEFL